MVGISISSYLFNITIATEKPKMPLSPLIDALIATKKPVCEKVAAKLQGLESDVTHYNLHLRSADLTMDELNLIAKEIKTLHATNKSDLPELRSLSLSYNRKLKDGLAALMEILPPSLTEIGLVDCGMTDKTADAIVKFALRATKLKMLCVEENAFSTDAKNKLIQLGKNKSGLLVVV